MKPTGVSIHLKIRTMIAETMWPEAVADSWLNTKTGQGRSMYDPDDEEDDWDGDEDLDFDED